jgi:hypothetical protein
MIVAVAALNVCAQDQPAASPTSPALPSLAKDSRFFELRTYHAAPGKLEALEARFRNFTTKLFVKHGMEVVGFWVPMNKDGQYENTLIYILAFPSREAREKDWKEFSDDLEWHAVKAESEKNGPLLIGKPESKYMTATDFSPIK